MPITSSIAAVAEFKGQQQPAVFQKACERIIDGGLDECTNILKAVVQAVEAGKADSIQSIITTLTNGNARLAGAIQQVGAAALPNAEMSALETNYRAVKSASRAQYAPEVVPDGIREATRTVTDLCAGAHMNAMRLLSALTKRTERKSAKPKVKQADTGEFDLDVVAMNGDEIPDGSTGDLTEQVRGDKKENASDSDSDFFNNIDLGDFGTSDDTPSDDDLKIDPKLPKKK